MIPLTFFNLITFFFLLIPGSDFGNHPLQKGKEKEAKNLNSMSVNLHLNTSHVNTINNSGAYPGEIVRNAKKSMELPPERFTETPLEMEAWMKSPKTWNK